MRYVDRTNDKNIYCAHCKYWDDEKCKRTQEKKHYWNRCKAFAWNEKKCPVNPDVDYHNRVTRAMFDKYIY